MSKPDTWYVAYTPDKAGGNTGSRATKTFASEADAKSFALNVLDKGWPASAGTINPHQPKQTIGPSQIEQWADSSLVQLTSRP